MESNRTIRSLHLENFLSFGSKGESLELHPLNVMIGPNASGKSNLIEALRVLSTTPTEVANAIEAGGGIVEYLWKGTAATSTAKIEVEVNWPAQLSSLRYTLEFTNRQWAQLPNFTITQESIAQINSQGEDLLPEIYHYRYGERGSLYSINPQYNPNEDSPDKKYLFQEVNQGGSGNKSILYLIRNPDRHPELAQLENVFANIQFYQGLEFNRNSSIRRPQSTNLPTDILWENASNLGLILNNFPQRIKHLVVEKLKEVYEPSEEIQTRIQGGQVGVFIQEKGLSAPISALRLSEGTLRYLCLLVSLLSPTPPPLICLEEPEIGLHPDVIDSLAQMLVAASEKTQLIVTTHSDRLISALANAGAVDSVVVCERHPNGTQLKRLDSVRLKKWLDKYSLGELWTMGEIGGTRW
ncbi:MAG: AAA family ATPase [Blastocatellia bacterium]|nr:AAA family ATPase [Blastocatellia bacterium]